MAGKRAGKVLCGVALTFPLKCPRCGVVAKEEQEACNYCKTELPQFCTRLIRVEQGCVDHPDATPHDVHPLAPQTPEDSARARLSPHAKAIYERIVKMSLAEKALELADVHAAESLASGDSTRIEAASRTLVNAMRVKSEE